MPAAPRTTVLVFRAAALFTLLAVVGGALVCATESGFECGNWPGCNADALLPSGPVNELLYRNPWIEMAHRSSAVLAGPLAVASALLATRLRGVHPLVKLLPWVTVAGAAVAGYVGRGIVLGVEFPAWVSAADLGSAILAMAAMVTATVALERTPSAWLPTSAGRLAWAASGTLLVFHLVSLYAAGPGSFTRCMSWPVWELLSADTAGNVSLQWVRFGLAAVAAAFTIAAVVASRAPSRPRGEAVAVGVLLGVVLATGLIIKVSGTDALGVPYAIATVGLLCGLVLLAARDSLPTVPAADAARPAVDAHGAGRA